MRHCAFFYFLFFILNLFIYLFAYSGYIVTTKSVIDYPCTPFLIQLKKKKKKTKYVVNMLEGSERDGMLHQMFIAFFVLQMSAVQGEKKKKQQKQKQNVLTSFLDKKVLSWTYLYINDDKSMELRPIICLIPGIPFVVCEVPTHTYIQLLCPKKKKKSE
ncbi:hypothetical protein RFI_14876 [Reticulomyxa filosa]|uniref:Uncharacterized protein n=1 Tax=Reticulomyxa filosa TaxID=46433 RepID=X6NAI6_RETFI|nr:hypothetical protein RFI_14876 [Reticulomyxa filosa]|eukprot:ETO22322.1 hypothetical protein RFI_14876 [Reticulomyxa filosa]